VARNTGKNNGELMLRTVRRSCIPHKSTIDTTDTTAARWRHTPTKLQPPIFDPYPLWPND